MHGRFADLMFTDAVQAEQQRHGSRTQYERLGRAAKAGDRLGEAEMEFIGSRDSFYMGTVTESGWPYVQHRGGNAGFLRVLDERTLGFADLEGNRQYISVGSLHGDDRVALFLMDYPSQSRLKILGHAEVFARGEGREDETERWLAKVVDPKEKAVAARAIVIRVEGYDWNCPQHITPRYTEEQVLRLVTPLRERLEAAEAQTRRLREAMKAAEGAGRPAPG